MILPISNKSKRPLTVFIEPLCDTFEVPAGGKAIVRLEDGRPHSIDVYEGQVSIWDEGTDAAVEVVTEEDQRFEEALQLARVWLFNLGAQDDARVMDRVIASLEIERGYVAARAQVFAAFHAGFTGAGVPPASAGDPPRSAAANEALEACRRIGAKTASLNAEARKSREFPGKGIGPLDTDTVREAFESAAAGPR